jgi:hypothetical protein
VRSGDAAASDRYDSSVGEQMLVARVESSASSGCSVARSCAVSMSPPSSVVFVVIHGVNLNEGTWRTMAQMPKRQSR